MRRIKLISSCEKSNCLKEKHTNKSSIDIWQNIQKFCISSSSYRITSKRKKNSLWSLHLKFIHKLSRPIKFKTKAFLHKCALELKNKAKQISALFSVFSFFFLFLPASRQTLSEHARKDATVMTISLQRNLLRHKNSLRHNSMHEDYNKEARVSNYYSQDVKREKSSTINKCKIKRKLRRK